MNADPRGQSVPSGGTKSKISGLSFLLLGTFLLWSWTGVLEAKGKKPPKGEDLTGEMTEEEAMEPEQAQTETPVNSREMPIDLPAKAEKIERVQPPPETVKDEQLTTADRAGRTIEIVWVWQETRDCLWRLAKKHYGDPWKWKIIFLANRSSILDPNIIYPKQRIEIPSSTEQ